MAAGAAFPEGPSSPEVAITALSAGGGESGRAAAVFTRVGTAEGKPGWPRGEEGVVILGLRALAAAVVDRGSDKLVGAAASGAEKVGLGDGATSGLDVDRTDFVGIAKAWYPVPPPPAPPPPPLNATADVPFNEAASFAPWLVC